MDWWYCAAALGSRPACSGNGCDVGPGLHLRPLAGGRPCGHGVHALRDRRLWIVLENRASGGGMDCRQGRPREGRSDLRGKGGRVAVALSRWLPILPEVIACMAGMVRMPFRRFVIALACGSAPLGFTFAMIGQWAHDSPGPALMLGAGLPPLLWAVIGPLVMRRKPGRTGGE